MKHLILRNMNDILIFVIQSTINLFFFQVPQENYTTKLSTYELQQSLYG